ncbi:hypothetical protein GCM10010353_71030 [Streptomyces chryseus]|nr:hypothetical protein GCM10010353_71030 [Streptomyces chryseus]
MLPRTARALRRASKPAKRGVHRLPGRAPHPAARPVQHRRSYVGRTPLPQTAGRAAACLLTPAADGHPWEGRTFSAGWGTRESMHVSLVRPELVVEGAVVRRL